MLEIDIEREIEREIRTRDEEIVVELGERDEGGWALACAGSSLLVGFDAWEAASAERATWAFVL